MIRPVTPGDADGLAALYASLSLADQYRRFFSAFRPPPAVIERWTRPEAEGGQRLVAVVGADGGSRIVAEAGYTRLANGNGDLAIAVAPEWRGWLGPFLLDALIEAAAAAGVPNLEADILLENRPMLDLVQARGYATVGHEELSTVRVTIGTDCRTPSWPPKGDRRRVLVEASSGRWRAEDQSRRAGLDVIVCPARAGRCPALHGEPCPLAAGADLVVLALDPDDRRARDLAEAHRRVHPETHVWAPGPTTPPGELVAGVLDVLGTRPATKDEGP